MNAILAQLIARQHSQPAGGSIASLAPSPAPSTPTPHAPGLGGVAAGMLSHRLPMAAPGAAPAAGHGLSAQSGGLIARMRQMIGSQAPSDGAGY